MRCRPGLPPAAAERGTQAAAATAEHSLPLRWTRRRPLRSAGAWDAATWVPRALHWQRHAGLGMRRRRARRPRSWPAASLVRRRVEVWEDACVVDEDEVVGLGIGVVQLLYV